VRIGPVERQSGSNAWRGQVRVDHAAPLSSNRHAAGDRPANNRGRRRCARYKFNPAIVGHEITAAVAGGKSSNFA
jgi:hypothetical protein